MSDGPELLRMLAARDGVHITSVEPISEKAYELRVERVVNGNTLGVAVFIFHTGETPWNIGAVLSQQIQAASGADPRFTSHVLTDFSASGYSDGSAGALRQMYCLLGDGDLYETYMGTYLDAAARGGAKRLEEMNRQGIGRASPSGGCALALLAMVGATWGAMLVTRVHG